MIFRVASALMTLAMVLVVVYAINYAPKKADPVTTEQPQAEQPTNQSAPPAAKPKSGEDDLKNFKL